MDRKMECCSTAKDKNAESSSRLRPPDKDSESVVVKGSGGSCLLVVVGRLAGGGGISRGERVRFCPRPSSFFSFFLVVVALVCVFSCSSGSVFGCLQRRLGCKLRCPKTLVCRNNFRELEEGGTFLRGGGSLDGLPVDFLVDDTALVVVLFFFFLVMALLLEELLGFSLSLGTGRLRFWIVLLLVVVKGGGLATAASACCASTE